MSPPFQGGVDSASAEDGVVFEFIFFCNPHIHFFKTIFLFLKMIRFEHVSLNFRGKSIFEDLNIRIKTGEKACVSGESGRGKTSLLKLIQGYVLPDSGSIVINDDVVSPKTVHRLRKEMAWIPQNINLPVNNGQELMQLLDISEKKKDITIFMEKLGLESDILDKDLSKISGGQKQRMAISIVLSLDRPIILMDEPTSSLDGKSIHHLMEVVDSLKDKTILSASHHQAWIDYSDKVIAL